MFLKIELNKHSERESKQSVSIPIQCIQIKYFLSMLPLYVFPNVSMFPNDVSLNLSENLQIAHFLLEQGSQVYRGENNGGTEIWQLALVTIVTYELNLKTSVAIMVLNRAYVALTSPSLIERMFLFLISPQQTESIA
jgi:hypothetical protein